MPEGVIPCQEILPPHVLIRRRWQPGAEQIAVGGRDADVHISFHARQHQFCGFAAMCPIGRVNLFTFGEPDKELACGFIDALLLGCHQPHQPQGFLTYFLLSRASEFRFAVSLDRYGR